MRILATRRPRSPVGLGLLAAVLSLVLMGQAPPDSGGAFSNGSFEAPVAPPGGFTTLSQGQPIEAWRVTQGNVDLIGRGFWQAADGVQSLDLSGSHPPALQGAVEQTFSTFPATIYVVSFALAGNPDGPPNVKMGKAVVNGRDVLNFSFDVTGKSRQNMGYERKTFQFLSLGFQSTLEFANTGDNTPHGPVIDDVTVEPCLFVFCHPGLGDEG